MGLIQELLDDPAFAPLSDEFKIVAREAIDFILRIKHANLFEPFGPNGKRFVLRQVTTPEHAGVIIHLADQSTPDPPIDVSEWHAKPNWCTKYRAVTVAEASFFNCLPHDPAAVIWLVARGRNQAFEWGDLSRKVTIGGHDPDMFEKIVETITSHLWDIIGREWTA